eukprot:6182662-Pleurochrysis_carterae.AAC.2
MLRQRLCILLSIVGQSDASTRSGCFEATQSCKLDSTCGAHLDCVNKCQSEQAEVAQADACDTHCFLQHRSKSPTLRTFVHRCTQSRSRHQRRLFAAETLTADEMAQLPALATYSINSDFNLEPDIGESNYKLSGYDRVQLQLKRWREGGSFGILENKL